MSRRGRRTSAQAADSARRPPPAEPATSRSRLRPCQSSRQPSPESGLQDRRRCSKPSATADAKEHADAKTSRHVTLGSASPELYAGIPGGGDLGLPEIKKWLADPKNHEVLDVRLPLGLSTGQSQMQGLKDDPLTRAKIELGRQMYFDTRLSSDATVSCASCHDPDEGFAAHSQFGIGVQKQTGRPQLAGGLQPDSQHAAVLGRPGQIARRPGQGPDRQPDRNGQHA